MKGPGSVSISNHMSRWWCQSMNLAKNATTIQNKQLFTHVWFSYGECSSLMISSNLESTMKCQCKSNRRCIRYHSLLMACLVTVKWKDKNLYDTINTSYTRLSGKNSTVDNNDSSKQTSIITGCLVLHTLQTTSTTACLSISWSSASLWHNRQAYTLPQHGAYNHQTSHLTDIRPFDITIIILHILCSQLSIKF